MVDLRAQYEKIKPQIDQAIQDVILSSNFINGPEVKSFETQLSSFLSIKNVISCGNGTDALQIAFMALNLKPGDEVIFPAFTYIAPIEASALLGLKPILADVDPHTFNIDPVKAEKVIGLHTKAIVAVHLFGQSCDMEKINKLAKEKNLFIIEDNAQAIGAEFTSGDGEKKMTGTMSSIGTTSFFPSKNLGCYGDGGALMTNDHELSTIIKMIANHGQGKKYNHDIIGVNSRLDTLQAAILALKLKHLKSYIQKRQEAASFYDKAFRNLKGIVIPVRDKRSTHVFHQYTIQVMNNKRDKLKLYLSEKGIPTMIYYPIPVHLQKALGYLGHKQGDFPVAEHLCESALSLPMHTELDNEQMNYIVETILKFFDHE